MNLRPGNGVSHGLKYIIPAGAVDVAEVVTMAITHIPTADGNVSISLPSLATVDIAVDDGVAEVDTLTLTAPAGSAGDVTITLPELAPVVVTLVGTEDAIGVATLIRAATFTGWATGGTDAVVTFTKDVKEAVTGSPAVDFGVTGVTGAIESSTAGVDADTVNGVATKIRAGTFTGWTTGGTNATVTFTKDVAGVVTGDPTVDFAATGVIGTIAISTVGANNSVTFDFRSGDSYPYGLVAFVAVTTDAGVLANPADLSITYPAKGVVNINGSLVAGTIIHLVAQRDCLNGLV